jgi:hypothetical protein
MVNARLTLPAPTRALVRTADPAHCKLSPRSRRGGRADALSATAVPESAALMLPNIAGCRILDLRSSPHPAVTRRSPVQRGDRHDSRGGGQQDLLARLTGACKRTWCRSTSRRKAVLLLPAYACPAHRGSDSLCCPRRVCQQPRRRGRPRHACVLCSLSKAPT